MNLQFECYYSAHEDALQQFARQLTRDRMEAEDLVQDTAIKAYRHFDKFIKGSSFKNWTFTILKNLFITKYNKRKKRDVVLTPVEEMGYAVDKRYVATNAALENIAAGDIRKEINQLSEKSRIPFELYVEGYKYHEIADQLDIPPGTVKSRINFARTKLKTVLQKKS